MSDSELGTEAAPSSAAVEPVIAAEAVAGAADAAPGAPTDAGAPTDTGAATEGAATEDAAITAEAMAAEAAAPCCAVCDPATAHLCELCGRPTCGACATAVNGRSVCGACRDQIVAELRAEQARGPAVISGLVGGLVGALISGVAWAVIAIVTGLNIGYVAVGVGYVAGYGVLLGARRKKAALLQWIAVGCATLGLLLGKYFIVAHAAREYVVKEGGTEPSYFNPRLVGLFFENIGSFLSPFDALWLFLALGVAWGLPKPTKLA
ncbi:MAG TPA: hypothetical protein VGQ83_05420 [Polyangia bacterium]|jgi:hypothetical protein